MGMENFGVASVTTILVHQIITYLINESVILKYIDRAFQRYQKVLLKGLYSWSYPTSKHFPIFVWVLWKHLSVSIVFHEVFFSQSSNLNENLVQCCRVAKVFIAEPFWFDRWCSCSGSRKRVDRRPVDTRRPRNLRNSDESRFPVNCLKWREFVRFGSVDLSLRLNFFATSVRNAHCLP